MKLIISIFCILCSCTAEVEREPNIKDLRGLCDGSEDLVLAVRIDSTRNGQSTSSIFADNGDTFIHLNGKCEFWTYGFTPENIQTNSGLRRNVRSGTLADSEAIELMDRLKFLSWDNFNGTETRGGDSFGGDVNALVYSKTSMFTFSLNAVSDRRTDSDRVLDDMTSGVLGTSEFLFDLGEPIPQGDLRVYISDEHPVSFWMPDTTIVFDWPIDSITVDDLVKRQRGYCKGQSFLITGENAKKVWEAREDFRRASEQTWKVLTLGVRDETRTQAISIRDVLPKENKLGLVEFGGRFSEESCD